MVHLAEDHDPHESLHAASVDESGSEKIVFHGTPSQWMHFNTFFRNGLIMLVAFSAPSIWNNFIAPFFKDIEEVHFYYLIFFKAMFFMAPLHTFWVWLQTYFHRYTVTTERFSEGVGVFSRNTEELELYRVKDITMQEPFSLRMFGLCDIVLSTSDRTSPIVIIHGVRDGRNLLNVIRKYVEIMRARKGVREID